jgi:hypothetical protein
VNTLARISTSLQQRVLIVVTVFKSIELSILVWELLVSDWFKYVSNVSPAGKEQYYANDEAIA